MQDVFSFLRLERAENLLSIWEASGCDNEARN
jgi:hypothetical protein